MPTDPTSVRLPDEAIEAAISPRAGRCRSRSRYGSCGRAIKHRGPHAVPIGDHVWYGYARRGVVIGYGYLVGDAIIPLDEWRAVQAGGEQ